MRLCGVERRGQVVDEEHGAPGLLDLAAFGGAHDPCREARFGQLHRGESLRVLAHLDDLVSGGDGARIGRSQAVEVGAAPVEESVAPVVGPAEQVGHPGGG
jgi:hypothetical protein